MPSSNIVSIPSATPLLLDLFRVGAAVDEPLDFVRDGEHFEDAQAALITAAALAASLAPV